MAKILDSTGGVFLVIMLPLIVVLVIAVFDTMGQRELVRACIELTQEVAACAEIYE
jgi:hypothetical protein